MTSDSTIYEALYLGSAIITDGCEKKTIKMATRNILDCDEQLLIKAIEVRCELSSSGIKVQQSHLTPTSNSSGSDFTNSKVIFDASYSQVSSYFILREDNKIVSLVIMNDVFLCEVHVFWLKNTELARQLVNKVYHNFQANIEPKNSSLMLSDDDESSSDKAVVEPTQSDLITSTCLLDL